MAAPDPAPIVSTLGHGARTIEEFVGVARAHGLQRIVDVRRFPGSRMHPQFGREALARALESAGIEYVFEGEALGGRRAPAARSRHTAIRSAAFRGYADHMETAAFRDGVERVLAHAASASTAVMCAETLPWRCHRFLLSDAIVAHGRIKGGDARDSRVVHVLDEKRIEEHRLNADARIADGRLVYDGRASGGAELPFPDA